MKTILDVGHQADVGLVRDHQEDAYAFQENPPDPRSIRTRGTIYVVADGVGGYQAGELASRIAATSIVQKYYLDLNEDIVQSLRQVITSVNKDIYQSALRDGLERMSTTVVCAVIRGDELFVAHVGDSRAYLYHEGEIHQLTRDHSWVAEQVILGNLKEEDMDTHPRRNIVTRSMGLKPQVEPDVRRVGQLSDGDRILLCTDGLYENVSNDRLRQVLQKSEKSQTACGELVKLANQGGGSDNITVIVVSVRQEPSSLSEESGPSTRPAVETARLPSQAPRTAPILKPDRDTGPITEKVVIVERPAASTPQAQSGRTVTPANAVVPPAAQPSREKEYKFKLDSLRAWYRRLFGRQSASTQQPLSGQALVRWEVEYQHGAPVPDEEPWKQEVRLPGGQRVILGVNLNFVLDGALVQPALVQIFGAVNEAREFCVLTYPGINKLLLQQIWQKYSKVVIMLRPNEIIDLMSEHGIGLRVIVKQLVWDRLNGTVVSLSAVNLIFSIETYLETIQAEREEM